MCRWQSYRVALRKMGEALMDGQFPIQDFEIQVNSATSGG